MMKILWLSHLVPYPPNGGVLQRSHHLLRELAKYHDVDLLAFNQVALMKPAFASIEAGINEAAKVLSGMCRDHRFVSIPVDNERWGKHKLAVRSLVGDPYTIRWLASEEFRLIAEEWISTRSYDLVHFDTISLIPYFHCVPPGTACILDHHNIESSMLLRRASNEKSWLRAAYYRQEGLRLARFEREYCPRFNLNITCSDLDSATLKEIAPASKVETVPNGVDTEYFAPGKMEKELRLIFVGRLNWYPNVQAVRFIVDELWPRLTAKWPSIQFDLVGANPPDFALQLGKRDNRFSVRGFVDDVRPYIARATAYVCPITDGGGTKLKVLDALAMGKALIAHPIACEGIAVEDGKNVLFARSSSEYIQHVDALIADECWSTSLGGSARKLVEERYAYSAIGRDLAALYERTSREPS